MDPVKRKVTAKLVHDTGNTYARVQTPSRPGSPTKRASPSPLPPSPFRPKAKVNGGATVRKLSSSSSLNVSKSNDPSLSRPGSPFKSLRPITNGSPSLPARVKAPVTSRPTSAAGRSPTSHGPTTSESRQRSLTSASPKLRPPIPDDRPRSGSVGLQQATSSPDLKLHPFPAQTSPLSDRSTVDQDQLGSPVLFSAKIRSKVSNLARSVNTSDASSPSSSLLATTHPIHVETRAPSFPSNVSLNTPISSPPSNPILYPITTAVPAANPYRYNAARPVQPPARNPQSVTSIQDMPTPKKSPLVPKVDPAAVPLTPQSPPISALSLSSKSSLSQTSNSSTTDLSLEGIQKLSAVGSHRRGQSVDWKGTRNPPIPQPNLAFLDDRRGHRRHESDVESGEESQRQSRAEAKTNRKIADLEITNHSLLAINASLETTKNRQAKEIRDLRRKLRESRLILPPSAYMALRSRPADGNDDEQDGDDGDGDGDDSDDDNDESFQRVRCLLDALIQSGRRALESKPEDFKECSTRVLNADELRSWRDSGQYTASAGDQVEHHDEDADDRTTRGGLSPAHVAMPDSDLENTEGLSQELAVSLLPPITITPS